MARDEVEAAYFTLLRAREEVTALQRYGELLAEEVGQTPDEFTCSEDLPAEMGAEIRCELTHEGESIGATVTVTSVDGSDVQWDVVVDDTQAEDTAADDTATEDDSAAEATADSVPAAEVAEQSAAVLEAQIGQAPENFTCSDDLPAQVGAELRCVLVDGGVTYGVTITATSVVDERVEWDILVDDQPL